MSPKPDINIIISSLENAIPLNWFLSDENPFRVLIKTVLSQRTRDENTEKATKKLFSVYQTPQQLASAKPKDIEPLIRASGFYKVKARRIIEISREIVHRFNGKVPETLKELTSLKGVGRKTANCVLVYAYKKPAIPVDVHVFRISNRIGLVRTKTPEDTERELMKIVPKTQWIKFNELFVKFGQRICKPTKPLCYKCPIKTLCQYKNKNLNP